MALPASSEPVRRRFVIEDVFDIEYEYDRDWVDLVAVQAVPSPVGSKSQWQGIAMAVASWTGASTSRFCGRFGTAIVTFSFAWATRSAAKKEVGYAKAFYTAVRGAVVMGYLLCSLGVSVLFVLLMVFRFGGDIYGKAAHFGADWVGMVA